METTNNRDLLLSENSSLMTSNKALREEKVKAIVNDVADGNLDATEVLIYAKKVIEAGTLLEKNVRPYAEGKAVIQKGGLTLYNATIIEKNSPSKYDYSVCKDSTYDALIKEREALDVKIKEREAFLKAIPAEGVATIEGEVVLPPDVTHGKMSLQVTLK